MRFDLDFAPVFHGYDAELCAQARAAGGRVLVGDLDVIHLKTGGLFVDGSSRDAWLSAHPLWHRRHGELKGF